MSKFYPVVKLEQVQEYFADDGRECNDCPFARYVYEEEGRLIDCAVVQGDFGCKPSDCPAVVDEYHLRDVEGV